VSAEHRQLEGAFRFVPFPDRAPAEPARPLPNVVITPHIASAAFSTPNAMVEICADNLLAGPGGQKRPALAWRVSWAWLAACVA
jgi:lactate dehydrogenase-like 2-hydroxyacid dehydrogenase